MIPKFRFWDKDEKYFITESTIVLDKDGSVEGIEYYYTKLGHFVYNDISYYELLQSTGVKARNGVEIYEGDVVKTKCGEYGRHIGVVTFKSGKFSAIGVKQYDGYVEELDGAFEIIGNKYEHPHLLKE